VLTCTHANANNNEAIIRGFISKGSLCSWRVPNAEMEVVTRSADGARRLRPLWLTVSSKKMPYFEEVGGAPGSVGDVGGWVFGGGGLS